MSLTANQHTTKVRCTGSELAIGYADGYGHDPIITADRAICPYCLQTIGVYRDPINVRIVEHLS